LFTSPQDRLLDAVELCAGAGLQAIQSILARPEYASDSDFASIGCAEESRWMAATELREHLAALELRPHVRLASCRPCGLRQETSISCCAGSKAAQRLGRRSSRRSRASLPT